ncbi:MAG: PAS domain S-box protein [Kovacikia sp.]
MILDSDDLQAIRECCRDSTAFAQVQAILASRLAGLENRAQLAPDRIDRSRAEEALQESETRYQSLYNNTPVMLHSIDAQGRLVGVSDYWLSSLGYERSEVLGRKSVEFMTTESRRYAETVVLPEYFRMGSCKDISYQFVKKTGEVIDVLLSAIAEKDPQGGIIRSLAVLTDITERRETEERLLQTEAQYRSIFESVRDGLVINDPDTGVVVEANPAFCRMHGYTREEFVGLSPKVFIHPDSYPLLAEYFATIKAGGTFRRRAVNLRKDGTPLHVEVMGTSFHFLGKPHLLTVVRDITDQIQAETALRESEAHNRALVNAIPDFIFRIREDGVFLSVKAAREEDLLLRAPELVGKTLAEVLPAEVACLWQHSIRQALKTGELQSFEYQIVVNHILRDREARIVHCGGQEVVIIMRDISERKQAERANDRERRLFAAGPVVVFRWLNEENWPVEYVSANITQFGYQPEDFTSGRLLYGSIIHPDDAARVAHEIEEGIRARLPAVEQDYRIIRADGEVRWIYDLCGIVHNERGEVTHYEGYVLDITDRKRTEAALRENEGRFRTLVEQSLVGIYVIQQGNFVYANPKLAEIFGYETGALIGTPVLQIVSPADRALVQENIRKRLHGATETAHYTLRGVRKDGVQIDLEALGSKTEVNGQPAIIGTLLDITERKRAEQALLESEEKFSKAFRSSPAAMTLTTLQDPSSVRLIDANDSFLRITGYQRQEVIGQTMGDLNIWSDLSDRADMYRALQSVGSVGNLEMRFRRKSGEIGVALLSAEIIQLKGEPCLLTVTIDITERKQAQEALKQSEARNRAFLNAIPDMMLRIHRDGTYLDCKAENIASFAIPPAEMIGRKVYDVLPPAAAQARMDHVERTLQTGTTQVYEYQLANRGEIRDYEARLVVSGKDEVLSIIRDITERNRAEAQLRANAERDRLLGQIALRIRRSLNLDQILTTTVEEVRQFLKADRVFIGQIDFNWQGRIVAESAATEWGSILAWITSDLHMREIRALFAQGQVRAIDDTAVEELSPPLAEYYTQCQIRASLGVPILLDDQFLAVLVAQQCSETRHWSPFEIELMSQLSTQVAIAIQQAELYQQVQSLNAGLEQQVQERTSQLQQSMGELQQLNQVKDDFLHAVSHDLRTPVMGMLMVLRHLQNKSGETATISRSVLNRMVQSSERQIAMINSLLEAHSTEVRGVDLECEQINVGDLVRDIGDDLEALVIENQATLSNQVSSHLPCVSADPALLRRVFENLLTNALKHNPPGLRITLQATIEEEMLRCSVQDNGVGMTQQECQSLFERYAQSARTRRSSGIGLGLYLCRQIITAHGGQIGAISAPGEGATFWFTLPLLEG